MDEEEIVTPAEGRRVLVAFLNDPMGTHIMAGTVKKLEFVNDHFYLSHESTKAAMEETYGKNCDSFIITTDLYSISADYTEFNPKWNYEVHIARLIKGKIHTLRLTPHMSAISKDLRYGHNWSRLTVGHTFDGALERSNETIPEFVELDIQ